MARQSGWEERQSGSEWNVAGVTEGATDEFFTPTFTVTGGYQPTVTALLNGANFTSGTVLNAEGE